MISTTIVEAGAGNDFTGKALPALVNAIGESCFGPVLAQYLNDLCGAYHFAAFRFEKDELCEVAACCVEPERTARDQVDSYVTQGWWRHDPAMMEVKRGAGVHGPKVIHVDLGDSSYVPIRTSVYPHVRDRLLLCGHGPYVGFGLSLVRADTQTPFALDAMDKVANSAELLMAVLSKHSQLCHSRRTVAQAITDLRAIESCIVSTGTLPRREAEVCARILYGMSSVGIALDLSVSEETIKTYRKRAYQRLVIGSERELLVWYLSHWSHSHGFGPGVASVSALH
jgi:DNA-binding CsgD family transcriptional regulator